jgi:competence protein ComEC
MPRAGWAAVGAVVVALVALAVGGLEAPGGAVEGLAGLAVAAIGATVLRRTNRPGALALIAAAALVATRIAIVARPAPSPVAGLMAGGASPTSWIGSVESVGSPRDGQQVATLELQPEAEADSGSAPGGPFIRVAATLPRYPAIRPGLTVTTRGRVQALSDDDYGRYLASSGVDGTLRTADLTIVGDAGGPGGTVETLRRAGDDALTSALPEPQAGLASGILIGLRDRVDRDLARAFTTAGVSHVVAISGWNIAIVGATIAALLRPWPRRRRAVATLLAIGGYTILTGASSSVLRAAVMAAVVLLARETGRTGRAAAALGWAIVGLIVAAPTLVTDPGFALSAAATGGLIAWATPLTRRLAAWRDGTLPGWLSEPLGVSLAAEFATLPIALAWFGRVPIVAPLVNLLVVPIVAPAMAAGGVAMVGGILTDAGAPAPIAILMGLPAWAALSAMIVIVRAAATLPFASATLAPPLNLLAAAIAGGAVSLVALGRAGRLPVCRRIVGVPPRRFAAAPAVPAPAVPAPAVPGLAVPGLATTRTRAPATARRPSRRALQALAGALVVVVVGVGTVALTRPDGRVRITVLDVGQGDAILVDADRGARMLIDGGPDPDRLLVALDAHVPAWDRRIDLLVLTHPHEDHVAGMALLLERYRVSRVVEPGMRGPGPGYRAWVAELAAEGRSAGRLATGDRFTLDDIRLDVLWPDRGTVPAEPTDSGTAINNVSIVLLGTFGRERFLLAGDIEEGIDPTLLSRGLPRVDFLKVAHHGSRTSSTDAFLDAVRPRIAAVSASAGNPYGHPAPATIERLRAHKAEVFRTDLDGTVAVTLDGNSAAAHAEGGRGRAASAGGPSGLSTSALAGAFRCGIPVPIGGPSSIALARPAVTPQRPRIFAPAMPPPSLDGTHIRAPARPTTAPDAGLYHRLDDGPRAGRRRRPAPVPRTGALGVAPCMRGGRSRRLAGGARGRPGDADRPAARGGRGPAP